MTHEELAIAVIKSLKAHAHVALLVGGCVRDRLLGIVPKDFDVATEATPQQIATYFPGSHLVGAHFGVVRVTDASGAHVEVATFRSEGAYTDGRRPDQVLFVTDPALDARRRDFTINGLMEDPLQGIVFDFVGGRADLATRTIRAIGDPSVRFGEDYLRMLRAVRFAARLDFTIEQKTLAALRQQASSLKQVSAERIRDELTRIVTEGNARRGLELLDQTGLLEQILPEVKAFQGVRQPPEFHPEGDVWTHVLLMLEQLDRPSIPLAFGVLLHDVGKPATFTVADRIRFNGHAEVGTEIARQILGRLRFSNEDTQQILALVANHMRFKDVRQMRLSTLKRFLCLPRFDEHLELHRLDCLASNGFTDSYRFVQEKLLEFQQEELRPQRLINGRDLIVSGFKPGPEFTRALHAVETAQLEGEIHSREEALELAKGILSGAPV